MGKPKWQEEMELLQDLVAQQSETIDELEEDVDYWNEEYDELYERSDLRKRALDKLVEYLGEEYPWILSNYLQEKSKRCSKCVEKEDEDFEKLLLGEDDE